MDKTEEFHQDKISAIDDESLEQVAGGARLSTGVTLNAKPGYEYRGTPDRELICYGCGSKSFNLYVNKYVESDFYFECHNCGSWRTN